VPIAAARTPYCVKDPEPISRAIQTAPAGCDRDDQR